jgi:kinesin family protein 11
MRAMDDFLTRARTANATQETQAAAQASQLAETVSRAFGNATSRAANSSERLKSFGDGVDAATDELEDAVGDVLDDAIARPLKELRDDIRGATIHEYEPTGDTPQRVAYSFPSTLPRTQDHEVLLAGVPDMEQDLLDSPSRGMAVSASETTVFNDMDFSTSARSPSRMTMASLADDGPRHPLSASLGVGLREVHPNVSFDPSASIMSLPAVHEGAHSGNMTLPLFRRSARNSGVKSVVGGKKATSGKDGFNHTLTGVLELDGRENVPPAAFAQSTGAGGKRKSPRLH